MSEQEPYVISMLFQQNNKLSSTQELVSKVIKADSIHEALGKAINWHWPQPEKGEASWHLCLHNIELISGGEEA